MLLMYELFEGCLEAEISAIKVGNGMEQTLMTSVGSKKTFQNVRIAC